MSGSDWEALYDAEEEKRKAAEKRSCKAAAQPSLPASASAKKTDYVIGKRIGILGSECGSIPLEDPNEERRRREMRIEQEDAQLIAELLDGCELTDDAAYRQSATASSKSKLARIPASCMGTVGELDSIQLKNMSECNKFVGLVSPKIDCSPAKSPAWLALMMGLLNHVVPKMEEKDLKTLQNKLAKMATETTNARRIATQNKSKGGDIERRQIVDYKEEYEMFCGSYASHEEDSEEDSEEE